MGLRTLCCSSLERSCRHAIVGTPPHACPHSRSWPLRLPACFQAGQPLERNTLPGCFCLDSCVPGFRPSRSHRCRSDVLLPSHSLELRQHVALTESSRDDLHGFLLRRGSTVEILLGLAPV